MEREAPAATFCSQNGLIRIDAPLHEERRRREEYLPRVLVHETDRIACRTPTRASVFYVRCEEHPSEGPFDRVLRQDCEFRRINAPQRISCKLVCLFNREYHALASVHLTLNSAYQWNPQPTPPGAGKHGHAHLPLIPWMR